MFVFVVRILCLRAVLSVWSGGIKSLRIYGSLAELHGGKGWVAGRALL